MASRPDYFIVGGHALMDDGLRPNPGLAIVEDRLYLSSCSALQLAELPRCHILKGQRLPASPALLDATGTLIFPGLIDLHMHGVADHDLLHASPATLDEISRKLACSGVTGFLATLPAAPLDELTRAAGILAEAARRGLPGAALLGIHLEGPWLNPRYAGAQDPACLRAPDLATLEPLLAASGGYLKMVTLAPELPGAVPLVRALADRGVVVALGHSAANYEEVARAVDAGLSHVTHIFNAMAPWHHREPGPAGAALALPLTVDAIADGVHLHPTTLRLLWHLKGPDRLILITDAVAAGGTSFALAGRRGTLQAGRPVLADGTLAGTTISLLDAVHHIHHVVGIDLATAVSLASANPARLLGLARDRGRLADGVRADLLFMTDDGRLVLTMVGGRPVTPRPA